MVVSPPAHVQPPRTLPPVTRGHHSKSSADRNSLRARPDLSRRSAVRVWSGRDQGIQIAAQHLEVTIGIAVVGRKSQTSGTEDCSPIAPSAGVPTGCRRTRSAARRSAIAPAGSKDGLRSRKAAKGYSSARPTHRAQASGSFLSRWFAGTRDSGEMYEKNRP